jgi:hypothetical protein
MAQNHATTHCAGTSAGLCAGFFVKKPNEINAVPDVPGSSPTFLMRARACAHASTQQKTAPHVNKYPRHIRHIRHILVFKRKNGKKGGTVNGTNHPNPAQHPGQPAQLASRTIRTTESNAKQVQQLVKADPQLHALVQSLQAQGLFPGLRAVTFHLAGTPEHCAQGLDAWPAATTTEAPTC